MIIKIYLLMATSIVDGSIVTRRLLLLSKYTTRKRNKAKVCILEQLKEAIKTYMHFKKHFKSIF